MRKIIGQIEAAIADGLSAREEGEGDDQNGNWEVHSN